jgi:hypothetical protein
VSSVLVACENLKATVSRPRRAIVEHKLLSGGFIEIRNRHQSKEKAIVQSAKTKREKRIVRKRFADSLGP